MRNKQLNNKINLLLLVLVISSLISACGNKINEQSDASGVNVSENSTEYELSDEVTEENIINEPDNVEDISMVDTSVYISECTTDFKSFMKTYSFPDWLGEVNNSTFVNSLVGFEGYKSQGKMVVSFSSDIESFDFFINDYPVIFEDVSSEKSYLVDFSNISKNGINTVQVTNIKPEYIQNAIEVKILFPTVLINGEDYRSFEGTEGYVNNIKGLYCSDSGIDERSFELIDSIVSSDVEYGFSAAQMAVVKDGKLVYANSWGNTNSYNADLTPIENRIKVNDSTLFDLASNTKMYTANFAIQYLVSKGEIDIKDKVADIIGSRFVDYTLDYKYNSYTYYGIETNKRWKSELTVENLLRHQAGFPASPKYEIKGVDQSAQRIDSSVINPVYSGTDGSFETREKTLESICKTPLMYEPGTKTLYSDVDFMLLCFIIEEITGQRFDIFLNETFYNPLGLEHITFNPLQNGFDMNDCAATELRGNSREGVVYFDGIREYTVQGEVHDEMAYFTMAGISGHAGLFSNATDLAILASTMLTGGMNDILLFDDNVVDTFVTPQHNDDANWGIGWWRNGDNERPWYFGSESGTDTFGHQGWTGTLTVIDPSENLVIVYLTNKINTPLVNKHKSTSFFEGGAFTSGSLGFATQLVYRGLNSNEELFDESLFCLMEDMVSESIKLIKVNGGKSAKDAAVRNAYSKMNVLIKYYLKFPAEKNKERVFNALSLFDEVRDAEAISYFNSCLK